VVSAGRAVVGFRKFCCFFVLVVHSSTASDKPIEGVRGIPDIGKACQRGRLWSNSINISVRLSQSVLIRLTVIFLLFNDFEKKNGIANSRKIRNIVYGTVAIAYELENEWSRCGMWGKARTCEGHVLIRVLFC
jgi:hypothetical protein